MYKNCISTALNEIIPSYVLNLFPCIYACICYGYFKTIQQDVDCLIHVAAAITGCSCSVFWKFITSIASPSIVISCRLK